MNRLSWNRLALALTIALPSTAMPLAGQATEEAAVLETVQAFFDAIADKDGEAGAGAVLEDARLQGLRARPDGAVPVQGSSGADFAQRLPTMAGQMLERMWDPEVRVRGLVATVWTPYDFHVDGQFSHCGVDAFTLIRTEEGWKIASLTWTVEPEGCAPSPLGPPA